MIKKQLNYWQECEPVYEVFNEKAREEGYYWIDVCCRLENKLIRVAYERPDFLSSYHLPFDAPYFVIPHFIFDAFNGISIRSLNGEKQRQVGKKVSLYTCENGIKNSENFEYQKPIVLCEGPMDAEFLGQHYPFVMAVKSTKPSQVEQDLLQAMTTKIIWVPDNDEAGKNSEDWFQYNLDADIMHVPDRVKDAGDLFYEGSSAFDLRFKNKVRV